MPGCFYIVFASKETLNDEKSSFYIGSTKLQFAVSKVIIATTLRVAQGVYKSGKRGEPGIVREFNGSGKHREMSRAG